MTMEKIIIPHQAVKLRKKKPPPAVAHRDRRVYNRKAKHKKKALEQSGAFFLVRQGRRRTCTRDCLSDGVDRCAGLSKGDGRRGRKWCNGGSSGGDGKFVMMRCNKVVVALAACRTHHYFDLEYRCKC
ncbi:hypothetical protein G3N56_16335 [Desulfovibrio sulfodismutans]|uniref:Uncharacterized protein n=1 Tax=Desulfolutivibrio sulfodismutans TaxID=63561 RepID=A0A7K3NQ17_9BACT|nr:hypothetical protein [Desulfolutivibrio sulfodismutans]NDY58302.1 hypothetical protein [Desulfolutivibrio sulfodismutans]QLA13965.1 hypothetical protein GD606_17695 [Desulfolutivibrio sulfodismutans DSM 3696]